MASEAMMGTVPNFAALGLTTQVLRPLKELGLTDPTPIQKQAVPLVLEGHDVMGLAQTGTGKTAAFGLPLIERLVLDNERPERQSARALILAPTRELVNQIADSLRPLAKPTRVWVSSVVGGQSINAQQKHLLRGTDILVATPGRLLDLVDRNAVQLDKVRYLVLDEADQMLDMGFIHALKRIAALLGKPRQTMLFSATMPDEVEKLSRAYLTDPVRVEVAPPGKAADKIEQSVHFISSRDKATLLKSLLDEAPEALSMVFARTKHGAEKLMNHLVDQGYPAVSIHGNKSQGQRDRALRAFKSGEARILVATDVAARGIDISGVTHVYNYNLPEVPENYVHRIGRTARAGRDGLAVAFCAPDERSLLRQIQKLMGFEIPVASTDGTDVLEEAPKKRGGGGNRNRKPGGRAATGKRRKAGDKPARKPVPAGVTPYKSKTGSKAGQKAEGRPRSGPKPFAQKSGSGRNSRNGVKGGAKGGAKRKPAA
ncbi:MAG: DEAD/DEAH box helicase [Pseudomonadota bacterium]